MSGSLSYVLSSLLPTVVIVALFQCTEETNTAQAGQHSYGSSTTDRKPRRNQSRFVNRYIKIYIVYDLKKNVE